MFNIDVCYLYSTREQLVFASTCEVAEMTSVTLEMCSVCGLNG